MYFSDLGTISLLLALGFALSTIVAAIVGALRGLPQMVVSAQRCLLVVTFLLLMASVSLIVSFLLPDFGVVYVANESSRSMPWYYVTAAFYGGQEGSLLYWATMLGIFSAIFLATARRAPIKLVPYVMATLMGIEVFFLFVLTTISNPFLRSAIIPPDGKGLNPLLMDPGMLVHPPLLLMGYMSFSLPFAFAIAALSTGQLNNDWLRAIRCWTLVAWTIQTAGLILGAWWAYHVLGWGGYWGWDPVENAALLPWLTATAFLHSAMVQQRRGMLKVWNLGLLVATFALSIFGTFEVRSGLINSVHSFVYSNVGPYYLTFLTIIVTFSLGLFFFRLPKIQVEQKFDSIVSREGVFLVNNLLLVGMTFAILWGTLFPLISASVRQQTMTVGPPFYNQVVAPLLALLILAMGIGPLLAWRRTPPTALWHNLSLPAVMAALCAVVLPLLGIIDVTANIGFTVCAFTAVAILYELWRGVRVRHSHGEAYPVALWMLFQRDRQHYGGYIVHLGLLLLVVGVIGSHAFQLEKETTLTVGQDMTIGSYRLTFLGSTSGTDALDNSKIVLQSQLQIWQKGQLLGYVYPGRAVYTHFGNQSTSIIPIKTFGATDLYVVLDQADGLNQASFHVFLNPLVPFVWYGGIIMCLGGIICWWPQRRAVRALKSCYEREQEIDAEIEEHLRRMKESSFPDAEAGGTVGAGLASLIPTHWERPHGPGCRGVGERVVPDPQAGHGTRRDKPRRYGLASYISILALLLSSSFVWGATPAFAISRASGDGQISGQLLDGSNGNMPLPGQNVTLQMAQGDNAQDLQTITTNEQGIFTFSHLSIDKTMSYAVFARYQGAQYLSDVVTLNNNPTQQIHLTVYEATQSTSKIAIVNATVLFKEPNIPQRTMTVSEAFSLKNLDTHTYVGSLTPSQQGKPNALLFSLPAGATNINLQKGFTGFQVIQVDHGFATDAAVLPGDNDFAFTFDMPYSATSYDFTYETYLPTVSLTFFVPPDIHASSHILASQGIVDTNNNTRPYNRLNVTNLPAQKRIDLHLEGLLTQLPAETPTSFNPLLLWLMLAGVVVLASASIVWFMRGSRQASRKKRPAAAKSSTTKPTVKTATKDTPGKRLTINEGEQALLDVLLKLDQEYEAGKLSKDVYTERRKKTKARLHALLSEKESSVR